MVLKALRLFRATKNSTPLYWLTYHLAIAPQPWRHEWPAIHEAGVRCVLDLRSQTQDDIQTIESLNMTFRHVPIVDGEVTRSGDPVGVDGLGTRPAELRRPRAGALSRGPRPQRYGRLCRADPYGRGAARGLPGRASRARRSRRPERRAGRVRWSNSRSTAPRIPAGVRSAEPSPRSASKCPAPYFHGRPSPLATCTTNRRCDRAPTSHRSPAPASGVGDSSRP